MEEIQIETHPEIIDLRTSIAAARHQYNAAIITFMDAVIVSVAVMASITLVVIIAIAFAEKVSRRE